MSELVAQGVDVNSSVCDYDTQVLAPLHLATGGVYCNVCTCSVLYCGYNCRPDITDLLLKVTLRGFSFRRIIKIPSIVTCVDMGHSKNN